MVGSPFHVAAGVPFLVAISSRVGPAPRRPGSSLRAAGWRSCAAGADSRSPSSPACSAYPRRRCTAGKRPAGRSPSEPVRRTHCRCCTGQSRNARLSDPARSWPERRGRRAIPPPREPGPDAGAGYRTQGAAPADRRGQQVLVRASSARPTPGDGDAGGDDQADGRAPARARRRPPRRWVRVRPAAPLDPDFEAPRLPLRPWRTRRPPPPYRHRLVLPFGKAKRAVIRLPTSVHDDRICCSTSPHWGVQDHPTQLV